MHLQSSLFSLTGYLELLQKNCKWQKTFFPSPSTQSLFFPNHLPLFLSPFILIHLSHFLCLHVTFLFYSLSLSPSFPCVHTVFKNTLKRYWFWFDEQTCSLKYYRNHESYALGIHEPLGSVVKLLLLKSKCIWLLSTYVRHTSPVIVKAVDNLLCLFCFYKA